MGEEAERLVNYYSSPRPYGLPKSFRSGRIGTAPSDKRSDARTNRWGQEMSGVDDILMGGGFGPSVAFEKEGDTHTFIIAGEGQAYQANDFTTKKPKFFPSGDPIMCVKYPVVVDDEEKQHSLYVEKREMKQAIRSALRIAGAPGLRFGDVLQMKRGKNGNATNKDTHTFVAKYTAATEETRTKADAIATASEGAGDDTPAANDPWATDAGTATPKF